MTPTQVAQKVELLRQKQRAQLVKSLKGVDVFPDYPICDSALLPMMSNQVRRTCASFPAQARELVLKNGVEFETFQALLDKAERNPMYRWKLARAVRKLQRRQRAALEAKLLEMASQAYLHYISPIAPLYLRSISAISPLYLLEMASQARYYLPAHTPSAAEARDGQLMAEAMKLASDLASGPTVALGLIRKAYWASASNTFEEPLQLELTALYFVIQTAALCHFK